MNPSMTTISISISILRSSSWKFQHVHEKYTHNGHVGQCPWHVLPIWFDSENALMRLENKRFWVSPILDMRPVLVQLLLAPVTTRSTTSNNTTITTRRNGFHVGSCKRVLVNVWPNVLQNWSNVCHHCHRHHPTTTTEIALSKSSSSKNNNHLLTMI